MWILAQFIFRTSFGLALTMSLVPPRQVSSGYFRNHLYVLLGLNSLATLIAIANPERFPIAPPLTAALLSYLGSAVWLYEKHRAGIATLVAIAAVSLWAAWSTDMLRPVTAPIDLSVLLDAPTSGLVLGSTLAAMFLGHWYLNAPGMALAPLRRLLLVMAIAILARAVLCAVGLDYELRFHAWPDSDRLLFMLLRWMAGIFGSLALTVMAYRTLKIPNTQSATGILYVAVIATFLGELTSLLLTLRTGLTV